MPCKLVPRNAEEPGSQQVIAAFKRLHARNQQSYWTRLSGRMSKPELASPYEALKAAELLAKLEGYNEPDKSVHNHVHLQVGAGLIEQLRAGYAQLSERSAHPCL
jgi:hypothetical protein